MKKSFRTKIIKKITSVLTAVIILVSSGYTAICNILGIIKNDNKTLSLNNKYEKNNSLLTQQLDTNNNLEIDSSDKQENENFEQENQKYEYRYTTSSEEYFIHELETTEAISQEENIDRIVRKRKKETEEKNKTTFNNK